MHWVFNVISDTISNHCTEFYSHNIWNRVLFLKGQVQIISVHREKYIIYNLICQGRDITKVFGISSSLEWILENQEIVK